MENLIKQNGETLVYIALFLPVIGGLAEVLRCSVVYNKGDGT